MPGHQLLPNPHVKFMKHLCNLCFHGEIKPARGQEMQLTESIPSPGLNPQHYIKPSVVVHTYNLSTWEVDTGGAESQGHP